MLISSIKKYINKEVLGIYFYFIWLTHNTVKLASGYLLENETKMLID